MLGLKLKYNILLICVLVFSCKSDYNKTSKAFDREDLLIEYLEVKTQLDLSNDIILVLFNTIDCGSCNIKYIKKVQDHKLFNLSQHKVMLTSEENKKLFEEIGVSEFTILTEEGIVLEKYGLRLFQPYIFYIQNGHITEWELLNG